MLPILIATFAPFVPFAPGTAEEAPLEVIQLRGTPPLVCDATRIALFAPGRDAESLARALEGDGLQDGMPWAIPGWWLFDTPIEGRSAVAAQALVDRIAREARVDFVSPVFVGLDGGPVFATPDLLVGFERSLGVSSVEHVLDDLAGFTIEQRRFGEMEGAFKLRASSRNGRDVLAAAGELSRRADVVFAEPDMIFTGHGGAIPNDPLFPQCWGLHNVGQSGGTPNVDMNAPEAWDRTVGSPGIVIVIIDVGVDLAHPDLAQNMIVGADLTSDGPGIGFPLNAFDNHGTPVAGCAIAAMDNGIGIVGIAPGCHAASARTFISVLADGTWTTLTSWTIDSLTFAQSIGARVTNNSNIYGFTSGAIDQKYADTWNAGLVHFACSGNSAAGALAYPASIPVVNAVGAIQRTGALAAFSNTGPGLDFVAPGQEIMAADRSGAAGWSATGDYIQVDGTSFASPYAAGVAALVLSADPSLTSAAVEQILGQSAIDMGAPGLDVFFGHGRVQALNALELSCGSPTSYCITSPNSVGPGAVMTYSGSQSIATNNLALIAGGCPPFTFGRFFFGNTTALAPFGNGFRCVGGQTVRLAIIQSNIFGDFFDQLDFLNLPQSQVFSPGMTRYFQLWYRNTAAGGAGFNLSDGLVVHFCP